MLSPASARPASVPCTLPEVIGQVHAGERIWFDDGSIGGIVRRATRDRLEVEITHAREGGESLAGDKGINLPDSVVSLPALSEKDIADLAVVAQHADIVGLSFAQRAADVETLLKCLRGLNAGHLGLILKIETRQGFENLPELAFAAMASRAAGIMIARGDLAVECGYERLAEVQEEILWLCEAAHTPAIWATQVLETLTQKGAMNRAEFTDAAMSARAECVMLNKGRYVLQSVRTLDDILARLRKIKHLEVLRIGSRVPCHLPERITPELCATLKKHHPLYINTHFNHPDELTPAAAKGLGMLADAGIPLGCQTVLLRGVNDDVDVMKKLMQKLLAARVRPYYIYMCDNVAGVEHFKTTVEKGLEIVEGLRGWTSGLAVPHFVIDAPGGGGKIPLLPEYVVRLTDEEIVIRNFRGQRYVWKQPARDAEEVAATGTDGSVVPIRGGKGGKPKKKRAVRKTR